MMPRLTEVFLFRESGDDEYPPDDELDAMTRPDPRAAFDPPAQTRANLPTPGLSNRTTKPQHPVAASRQAAFRKVPDASKPKYRGSYLGHSVTTAGKFVRKPAAWVDRPSGERRFGGVQTNQKETVVWDGKDWVYPEEFDARFGRGKR